ncbi:MAG TPA: amino acid carrier protein, partial [Cryomorphaceae bacterium]|nr:amino acid carrier protein [Cryomorphaceae bacterium]
MSRILLFLASLFCAFPAFAQTGVFNAEVIIDNPSDKINDASALVNVQGGTPPYHYYWSKTSTDSTASKSLGMAEGASHYVTITDASGNSVKKEFSIPANSLAEHFNGTFKPIVDGFASVIFWDPFYAMGLYDNRVYNDVGKVSKFPNGTVRTNQIPFIVIWLIFGALFFTIRMGGVQFWGWRHSIKLVRGKFDEHDAPGEVTHFQALATAVSATVGLGNIAGVAVAISIGGPGATFWLIIAGLLGMASKFTECTLGVKYRDIGEDGVVEGGPMRYLRKGLARKNMKGLGQVLAVIFAILTIGASFGGGNMFQ